ncbi:hypothetical protein N1851_032474 [Merluccius polli]|uniref:Uncharacterized protein n=1 Tax=Merluccius polli TaxID=89951 RepID=A0AA47NNW0_MERPO|nr:hypothetical protein N1851_032474 [Merluccius polli]
MFLANLKSSANTLSSVNNVVHHTSELIDNIVETLQAKTMSLFAKFGHGQDPEIEALNQDFLMSHQPFKGLESDFKQIQYFTKSGHFIEPIEEEFQGQSYVQRTDSETGTVRQVAVKDTFQHVPLRPLLTKLLGIPGIMKSIIDWQHRKRDSLQDLYDGEYCRSHPLFSREFSIPLMLYADDCEMVNPLGSKTGTHTSNDAKQYSIDAVLCPIVDEIQHLEQEGIVLNTDEYQGVVKFTVVQMLGDNLGLNAMLGYNESFSGNHVCRWCKVHRDIQRVQTVLEPELTRTVNTHQTDLDLANPSLTGLKRDSVLNRLSFYHVTHNVAPDIMHDILEGVGPYEIKLVLNALIDQKVLSLDQLNYRLTSFDYGFSDRVNKPSLLSRHDLKNVDKAMRQSAAQTWCLLRLLPLLIGDLIPEDNQQWELLLMLLNCMEFIFSPSITSPGILFLEKIIQEHHSLFLELFPDLHLRPKHHFMLHYPMAIKQLGPLRQYWAMRFEAKHGFFKRICHVTCNFRNIAKTMAFRHQLMQCHHFMSNSVLSHIPEIGPGNSSFLATVEGITEIQVALDVPLFSEAYLPAWVKYKGSEYRSGMMVFLSCDSEGDPQFGLIKTVLVLNETTKSPIIKLAIQKWQTTGFERHFFAYTVVPTSSLIATNIDDLFDHHPLHAVKSYRENDDRLFISLRYRII